MTVYFDIKSQSNANLNLKMLNKYTRTSIAIDFTGYKGDMEIRERKNGYIVLAKLSSWQLNVDGTITLDSTGIIQMNMEPGVLLNKVGIGTWYFDLVLTRPDGLKIRWAEGKFIVSPSTTIESVLEG